ncbi:MAG: EthD family reductase [Nitrososphaera sp.]|nr:EthD family reductase [Nitrososphaera sp.]
MTITESTEHGTDKCVRSRVERREFLKFVFVGIAVGASATGHRSALASAAEVPASPGKAKVVFVLFRRADLTHEQSLAEWNGERHTSIVRKIPGLKKWVQNHIISAPNEAAPDGIGELWFDNAEAREQAMNSPEMAAAVEDAKNFLDMERTYALVVDEKTIIG